MLLQNTNHISNTIELNRYYYMNEHTKDNLTFEIKFRFVTFN